MPGALQSCVRLIICLFGIGLSACSSTVKPPLAEPPVQPSAAPAVAPENIAPPSPPNTTVTLTAVGDIMLGGKAAPVLAQQGYMYPFAATAHLLHASDLALGNLETALTQSSQPWIAKKYQFRNPPTPVATALKQAGIDIVSLANNHSMDYGPQGLLDTIAALRQQRIHYHGAGMNLAAARQPVIITLANGQTIGFLAYSNTFPKEFWADDNRPGTAFGHAEHVRADVQALVQQNIDIIVVSFHWGREKTTELRAYQPMLAHTAIDAGADAVIGHHPHVVQAVEQYKSGVILYSLGNYTFTTYSPNVHSAIIAQLAFEHGRFSSLRLTPLNINNFDVQLQPQILSPTAAAEFYQQLQRLSLQQNTALEFSAAGVIQLKNSVE